MRGATLAFALVAVTGAGFFALVSAGRNSDAGRMRAEMVVLLERGGAAELGRAQSLGRRLVVSDERDREAATALAFTAAVLATDYGMDTAREARLALGRGAKGADGAEAGAAADADAGVPIASLAAAARALLLGRTGARAAAIRLATASAAANPGTPYALYALGRVRTAAGDGGGAARAMKAAIVGTPAFNLARVAWAELRLDQGDAAGARAALGAVLARSPGDLRAGLLLDEAEQSLGLPDTGTLRAACPPARDRWPPLAVTAGCALARSSRARRAGARAEALAQAEDAARLAPLEPRLLARIAQALAQLGAVDRAAGLLDRARGFSSVDAPALAWAGVAVALGRGHAASPPVGPPPADPEVHLLLARVALAAGGVGALATSLAASGEATVARDVDLQLLARLREGASRMPAAIASDDPVRAYVDGLRARLEGNLPTSVSSLRNALSGHGDACRAAGEYVAMLRVLKMKVDPGAWNLLRAENASCVNLRAASPP